MYELKSWTGKVVDLEISYDFEIDETRLLPEIAGGSSLLGGRLDAEWETSVGAADRIDYAAAVCCGSIAAIVDSMFVGEFSLQRAEEWGSEKIEAFVCRIAKTCGCKSDGLRGCIVFLEENYGLASDSVTSVFGGGRQHHLRDFSHHCSIVGLICSLFTQFSGKAVGTDEHGSFLIVDVADGRWIGKTTEEKIFIGTIGWFLHMASDMAGSRSNPGAGTGVPGPILSLVKELSALPLFKDASQDDESFRKLVSKLFNGTLLAERDANGRIVAPARFDLRAEMGALHEISRQFIPVVLNECLVRSFFFARRLVEELSSEEIKGIRDLAKLDVDSMLPFGNARIARMLTVSCGVLTVVDFADAAVRSAVKHRGNVKSAAFWADFAVRINIVGVGRFGIAIANDWKVCRENSRSARTAVEALSDATAESMAAASFFSLTFEQCRLLLSIERQIVRYDCLGSRQTGETEGKIRWGRAWEAKVLEEMPLFESGRQRYFLDGDEIVSRIEQELAKSADDAWLDTVILEAVSFEPYRELPGEDNSPWAKAKCRKDYIGDVLAKSLTDGKRVAGVRKVYERNLDRIGGGAVRKVAGAAGSIVIAAGAGAAAFAFAPVVAPSIAGTLFGNAVAGLSGAALTSASLAALGGGALAAGGFGMAGGTALITGGGALLGLAGGAGAGAISIGMCRNSNQVLVECAKLLALCGPASSGKGERARRLALIHRHLRGTVLDVEREVEEMASQKKGSRDKAAKQRLQSLERSLKYLRRTEKRAESLLKKM